MSVFCAATLSSALNFTVTTIDLRAKGMTLPRLPLTVWAWFINAILGMLVFSILLAACLCLLSDRFFSTHFFSAVDFPASPPANVAPGASPVLWQRLFWFFAQAEVYIAMLPCFGIVSHLIATFSRRPVWRERLVVLALCGVGLVGFCVWGQHMFSSGLNPFSPLVFSVLAASLELPATILLVSWFAALWNARFQLNTSLLFALGFVSLFLSGGISGLFLARHDFTSASFMPMHWLGLGSHVANNPGANLAAIRSWIGPARSFITAGIVITVFAQAVFLFNFLWSLFFGDRVEEHNPWRATTLEWSMASPPPRHDFGAPGPVVYRGAYAFAVPGVAQDYIPQHVAPDRVVKAN